MNKKIKVAIVPAILAISACAGNKSIDANEFISNLVSSESTRSRIVEMNMVETSLINQAAYFDIIDEVEEQGFFPKHLDFVETIDEEISVYDNAVAVDSYYSEYSFCDDPDNSIVDQDLIKQYYIRGEGVYFANVESESSERESWGSTFATTVDAIMLGYRNLEEYFYDNLVGIDLKSFALDLLESMSESEEYAVSASVERGITTLTAYSSVDSNFGDSFYTEEFEYLDAKTIETTTLTASFDSNYRVLGLETVFEIRCSQSPVNNNEFDQDVLARRLVTSYSGIGYEGIGDYDGTLYYFGEL